ncbi:hypothetical protein EV122DRAFT_196868, partial [Schizophyllum commune]
MTDYASQGKTRPINVVNLENSRSHQAYYTALSRSSSASGTAIVSSFSGTLLQKGLDVQLKREFRNLELLNEITRLRYVGELPEHVVGDTRNQLIRSFLDWRGEGYELPTLHRALRWQSEDEWEDIRDEFGRQQWQFAEVETTDEAKPKAGQRKKRKNRDDDEGDAEVRPSAKQPRTSSFAVDTRPAPRGYRWDATDWSCPYDSLFTILHSIWTGNPARW